MKSTDIIRQKGAGNLCIRISLQPGCGFLASSSCPPTLGLDANVVKCCPLDDFNGQQHAELLMCVQQHRGHSFRHLDFG